MRRRDGHGPKAQAETSVSGGLSRRAERGSGGWTVGGLRWSRLDWLAISPGSNPNAADLPTTITLEPRGAAGSPQGAAPRHGPESFSTGLEAAAASSEGSNASQGFVGSDSVGPQQQAASRHREPHPQNAPWSSSTSEAADIAAAPAL